MKLEELKRLPEGTKILFRGKEFYSIEWDDSDGLGVPLCTEEQYRTFSQSFAHVHTNGEICRLGVPIGTVEDIELLNKEV